MSRKPLADKLLIALLTTFFMFQYCTSGKSEANSSPSDEISFKSGQGSDSIPLLVCGTFFNADSNYTIKDLYSFFSSGKLHCTKDIVNDVTQKFKLTKNPPVIEINKINFANDSLLVITTLDSLDCRLLTKKIDGINFFKAHLQYGLWIKSSGNKFDFKKEITSYAHTGVTAITRGTGRLLDHLPLDQYLNNLMPYFSDKELVHVSNEVSMEEVCDYNSMKLKFSTKKAHFEILKKIRANIIELTGNHNLDVGITPYLNSLNWYKENNMQYFGGGKNEEEANQPLIVTLKDGKKIAWIGFNELCPCGECTDNPKNNMGASRYSATKAKVLLNSLKKERKADYVLACVQFGERDSYEPSVSQTKISRELIDFGADVVIGSQAHQPQTIEMYGQKLIFYGLGNFLFDQIHRLGVRQAFFLECYIYKGKIIQFQPVYTLLPASRIPTMATKEEASQISNSILMKKNF